MDGLRSKPCDTYPADEETPDGLRGTPSERFTEAARRVFGMSKERLAEREEAEAKNPSKRSGPGRPRKQRA
jgi:hypothetical protein